MDTFVLDGIEQISEETLKLVKKINVVVAETGENINKALPKIYLNMRLFEIVKSSNID